MTMVVSQCSRRLFRPFMAFSILILPSALNGRVTTPMTKAPCLLAISATTGAEPVPVPPPMPAVTNTMFAPSTYFRRSPSDSSAACCPISGMAPAPSPLVVDLPSRTLFGACMASRCRASVLQATMVAPDTPAWVTLLAVFEPPPPQPMMEIFIRRVSTSFISSASSSLVIDGCMLGTSSRNPFFPSSGISNNDLKCTHTLD